MIVVSLFCHHFLSCRVHFGIVHAIWRRYFCSIVMLLILYQFVCVCWCKTKIHSLLYIDSSSVSEFDAIIFRDAYEYFVLTTRIQTWYDFKIFRKWRWWSLLRRYNFSFQCDKYVRFILCFCLPTFLKFTECSVSRYHGSIYVKIRPF